MDAVKSLVILEFKKITYGYKFLSQFGKNKFDFFEINPQAPSKLVCLIGGSEREIEEVWVAAQKIKKNIIDFYLLKNHVSQILKSLYGQQKPSSLEFFGIIQTKSISAAVKISDDLLSQTEIYLLEIDSGRSLSGTSLVYFSGSNSELKNIEKTIKAHKADLAVVPKGSAMDRYFQLE